MHGRAIFSFAIGLGAVILCNRFLWELPWWGNILLFMFASGTMLQALERDAAYGYLARKGDDYEKRKGD